MEREVSLLRCSKLSCYSEFNRMVQAIARNGGERGMPGTRLQKGTSAEYNFYATLVLMLKQVISNKDPVTQKYELQRVYEWFSINKPLIKPKTKPSHRKPKVSITKCDSIDPTSLSFPELDTDRPQTAPPSLYKTRRSFDNDTRNSSSARSRTQTPSKGRSTFTAMYVSRSLCGGLDLIGQTFDQLQLKQKQRTKSEEGIRPPTEFIDASTNIEGGINDTPARESRESTISLIDLPHSDVIAILSPHSPGHTLQTADGRSVSLATVFSMAPSVAAQMTLEREMNEEFQNNRRKILSRQETQTFFRQRNQNDFISHHRLVTTPETEGPKLELVKPMLYRESDRISTSIATEESTPEVQNRGGSYHKDEQNDQPSPRSNHTTETKVKENSKAKFVVKGSEQDSSDKISLKQSVDSPRDKTRHPPDGKKRPYSPALPEAQETVLNMKAVSSRQSLLSHLSQISLTPRDSTRTKDKEDSQGTSLHIEGQAVRLSAESGGQKHMVASSQKDHSVSPSPMVSTRLINKTKTEGLNSLTIRPVSLQQYSGRISAANAAPLKQDLDKSDEKKDNTDVMRSEPDEERLEDKIVTETEAEKDTSKNPDIHSTNSQIDVSSQLKANEEEHEEASNLTATAKSEETNTTVSGSQVTQDSSLLEVTHPPVMVIKESSSTPPRPHSLKTSYSRQKSASLRHPSPMNVVSLSFPSKGTGSKLVRSRTDGFLSSDAAKKKTPAIIAGFNRKRYKRMNSPRSVVHNQVFSSTHNV